MNTHKADINLGMAVGASGRYWVKVHDGAGNVLRESSPGKNLLLNKFFNDMQGDLRNLSGTPVVGVGNTVPAVTDATLASYSGKCNSVEVVAGSYSYDDTPNADGYVRLRQTYVAHYLPGRLGASALNLAEAGISSADITTTIGSTNLYSRGLLVDGSGLPTTVPYNAETEYLDVYWELTLWFKAEVSGTFSIDILGTPTTHDYVCRIANWRRQASSSNGLWGMPITDANGIQFDSAAMRLTTITGTNGSNGCYACSGPIGTIAQLPTASGEDRGMATAAVKPFVATGQRDWELTWAPASANISGGIGCIFVSTGTFTGGGGSGSAQGSSWQISISPKINKTSMHHLKLDFRTSMGNYTP